MAPKGKELLSSDKTVIQSSGKSVASILFARLVDQGLASYDDPIMNHWPEYA